MATIDLREFHDSEGFVVHFGGRPNEVDVYTFANAMVAFSDAYREISKQLHPEQAIELRLEAVGPGSFRGKVRGVSKGVKGLFRKSVDWLIMPILAAFIYENYLSKDGLEIIITDDEVIIQHGDDRVILPKSAYEAQRNLPDPEKVHQHMGRAIEALEEDESVESFGIARNLRDEVPFVDLPRSTWGVVRERSLQAAVSGPRQRIEEEEVTLTILKAVFASQRRKWEFVWRGVKISAYIEDPVFIADLMQRKHMIGNGDALRCILAIGQEWSDSDNVWLNTSYAIQKVLEFIPATDTDDLFR